MMNVLIALLIIGYGLLAYWVWNLIEDINWLIRRMDRLNRRVTTDEMLMILTMDGVFPDLLTAEQRQEAIEYLQSVSKVGE